MDIKQGDAAAIIEAAREGQESKVIVIEHDGVSAPMLLVAKGNGAFEVHQTKTYIDAFRKNPERRKGIAKLSDLSSFIAHAKRFKDSDSAIFISDDPAAPSFLSVLNYHEAVNPPEADLGPLLPAKPGDAPATVKNTSPRVALPRFGDHRGSYAPEFSDEWTTWTGKNGVAMSQADFAALIEKGARDIFDVEDEDGKRLNELPAWFAKRFGRNLKPSEFYATSAQMVDLADGLSATFEDTITDIGVNGPNKTVSWTSKTSTGSVVVPPAFLLSLPVFEGGDPWQVPARLKMTPKMKGEVRVIEWTVNLYVPERTIKACLADMGNTVREATGLPIFVGAPE